MRTGLAMAALWVSALAGGNAADELDTLFQRYRAGFLADNRPLGEAEARAMMANLRADGTWPDIDLKLTEQSGWTPAKHLSRLLQLSRTYVEPGHALAGDSPLKAKFAAGLDAWIRANPRSTNWWHNEIGALLTLGPVLYLMKDELTAAQRTGADSLMARAWKSGQRTGQNLVWISRITIWRAVLNRDEKGLQDAASAIAGTITISTAEGIQRDYSFHQHGAQLYSGGYGAGYAEDGASAAADLRGTRFGFPPAKLEILAGYLLHGQRWMTRGSTFDHSTRGREITRSGNSSAGFLAEAAADLAPLAPDRAADLDALAATVRSGSGSAVEGNRWMWRSEYMAHHRKPFFLSLRMASRRLLASELINQEGLLSQYLADGATFLYRSGREYDAVFPVWDWCRIPGVTAGHAASPPAMVQPHPGVGDFAGGVSDGRYGAAAFDYARLGVKARKAWFFLDEGMFALGAGIASTDTAPVQTSLNQCLLSGPVQAQAASGGPQVVAPGAALPGNTQWVLHDSVGYVFPAGVAGVGLAAGKASGNWRRANAAQSAATVDKDMFSLWIDHGRRPADAAYQYAVLMGMGAEAVAAWARQMPVQVLSNTATAQAIRHAGGMLGAVCYGPATVRSPGRYAVTADRACVLLIREESGRLVVTASDPRAGTADLRLDFDVRLEGAGAAWSDSSRTTRVTLPLPKGDSAGAPATRAFSAPGVSLRPAAAADFSLSARRGAHGSAPAWRITFTVPGPGKASLAMLDAAGRELAGFDLGRVGAGARAWDAPPDAGKAAAAAWVRLEWNGRSLVAPLRGL